MRKRQKKRATGNLKNRKPARPVEDATTAEERVEATPDKSSPPEIVRVLAEVATSLWYLKTKHFKQQWRDTAYSPEDPRDRRALSRIEKAVESLASAGIEVNDPTNSHYQPGSEGLMRPIEFVPTEGVEQEVVSEAMRPAVTLRGKLVQRAEVFVAVPNTPGEA